MKRFNVEFSVAARDDVRLIAATGVAQFGKQVTNVYLNGLDRVFLTLSAFPEAGRQASTSLGKLRVYSYRQHVVAYIISDGKIEIVRILPGRSDWLSMFGIAGDDHLN